MSRVAVKGIAAVCSVLLIALALSSVASAAVIQPTSSPVASSVQPASAAASSEWHEGTNQSTPQVNVYYGEWFWAPGTVNNTLPELDEWMSLIYNDGTRESTLFDIQDAFNPGGLNVSSQQVLDWSKLNNTGVTFDTWGCVNGTQYETLYAFSGFDIINGTANDFTLYKVSNTNGNGSYMYVVNDTVGSINYGDNFNIVDALNSGNGSIVDIGAVTLSTVNATYNGQVMTESVADFNVTIQAQMSDLPLGPVGFDLQDAQPVSVTVPVVLMFQITHDTAHTEAKYGVDIDWSAVKDFPTATEIINGPVNQNPLIYGALKNGDNFSLVAQDRLGFSYGVTNSQETRVPLFSTDAENDSAIYLVNGTELCRELFPTNYTINGSPQVYNTTRIYVPVSDQNTEVNNTWNQSSTFVVFGGFYYNQSTGFTFDPAVITPNSVAQALTEISPTASNILMVIILAVTIAIVFRRPKRTSKTLKETPIKA